jgi:site-specific recombinase
VGVPGNETTDEAVKEVLDEEIQHNEKYLLQDLIKWLKNKQQKEQQHKWERLTSTIKELKPFSKRIQTRKQ